MKLLFWIPLALVIYTYLGYPLLLFVLASMHQVMRDLKFALRRSERRSRNSDELPSVSLIFSAFNEEAVIKDKMSNCAELKYPAPLLEVLIGCDGCTDATAALARRAGVENTLIFDYPIRRGKPVVVNHLVDRARGEIVIFSDANTMLAPDALLRMVRHFQNPAVGCVCGELMLRTAANGNRTEGAYWRYEVFLKFLESRLNMLVGANGGIFAIRRTLFSPIPGHGIIDDFLVSLGVRQKGFRLVYDPEATATEQAAITVGDEFRRRVRIGAGNFHALRYTWKLLSPTAGLVSLAYWSHKVLRWLVPLALVLALCSAMSLAGQRFYAFATIAALALCAMGLVGYYLERDSIRTRLFGIPYYFLSMNLALALGLLRCLSGRQMIVWNRTPRETTMGASE
jgi:cellulose synthase/poly-beta-1,6-N-acetylglucosamine synthase-like glycosyltransferase